MRTLNLSLGGAARLCATFLSGALFGFATLYPDATPRPLLGIIAGAALWIVTLAATRNVTIPWLLQLLAMAGGAATIWMIALVLAVNSMD